VELLILQQVEEQVEQTVVPLQDPQVVRVVVELLILMVQVVVELVMQEVIVLLKVFQVDQMFLLQRFQEVLLVVVEQVKLEVQEEHQQSQLAQEVMD
jgi:hypothetical protein